MLLYIKMYLVGYPRTKHLLYSPLHTCNLRQLAMVLSNDLVKPGLKHLALVGLIYTYRPNGHLITHPLQL